jgi:hypothetical protein
MKAVYVLVPMQVVVSDNKAILIGRQPTLNDINEMYEEFGAYKEKDVALVDLMCVEHPNAEWEKNK